MTLRVHTQPVPTVTITGGASAPMPEPSGEVFRGSYIPLVQDGSVKTFDWLETQPLNTVDNAIKVKFINLDNNEIFSVATGFYGDDCIAFHVEYWEFTTDFAADNETLNSTSHGLTVGDNVKFTSLNLTTGVSGTLPAGLTTSYQDSTPTPYYVVSTTEHSFKVSASPGGDPVQFTSDGSGKHYATTTGLPAWWLGPARNAGGVAQFHEPASLEKYFAPSAGRPYNRLELLVKAPLGYRELFSQSTHFSALDNHDFGSYHAATAWPNDEDGNHHFYLQAMARYDLADGEWIRIKFNSEPSHMRSISTDCVVEPVVMHANEGTFWDTMTRWYWEDTPYFASPEINGAFDILYDRLRVYYEEPAHGITVTWDSIDKTVPQYVTMDGATETFFYFTIANSGAEDVPGYLVAKGYYSLSPQVQTAAGGAVSNPITVPAGGTWQGRFRVMPSAATDTEGISALGPVFTPSDQLTAAFNSIQPSISDSNVHHKNYRDRGPVDAHNYGVGVRILKLT